jgi:hypothetical protein
MGEFCSLRIAPINRDLRDIVDFVDLLPFFEPRLHCPPGLNWVNHKTTRYTKQGLPLRRNYVCPAFNPPDIQSFLRRAPLNFYPVKPYRLTGTEGQGSLPRCAPLNRVPLGCSTGVAPEDVAGAYSTGVLFACLCEHLSACGHAQAGEDRCLCSSF